MTLIDLNRSQFLLPMLKNMISELTKMSMSDSQLNQKLYELHHFLSEPKEANGEELMATVSSMKDLASSYDHSLTANLPNLFYGALAEIEHMVKSKKLSGGDKVAQLMVNVEHFQKLAIKGSF